MSNWWKKVTMRWAIKIIRKNCQPVKIITISGAINGVFISKELLDSV